MATEPIFVELLSDDESIDVDADEYTVVEVDDDSESGLIVEDLKPVEYAEESDGSPSTETQFFDPVVEEPDDIFSVPFSGNVELFFNSSPLPVQPKLHRNTSIRDLFQMARHRIDAVDKRDELWFQIEPLGLEVGEENSFTYEPTVGDLLQLLEVPSISTLKESSEPYLKINIESRQSFYYKFRDMLSNLSISTNTVEPGNADPNMDIPNKKKRMS